MNRRGDEHARSGRCVDGDANVGGIERPCRREGIARQQGEQHRRLEAVHVLRGHGADERSARGKPKRGRRAADTGGETSPGLAIREGRTRRARSEHDGGELLGGNERWTIVRHRRRRVRAVIGEANERQLNVAIERIGQAKRIGRELSELAHDLSGMGGREETHAARNQAGRESHRESITIDAGVEHMPTGGQRLGETVRVGEELPCGDGSAAAVSHHRGGGGMRQQGLELHGASGSRRRPAWSPRCRDARCAAGRGRVPRIQRRTSRRSTASPRS